MKIKNLVFTMILAIFVLTAANCGGAKFNREELGKEDIVSLFNGKDLAGWINGPDNMVSRLPKWTSISGQNPTRIRMAPRANSYGH